MCYIYLIQIQQCYEKEVILKEVIYERGRAKEKSYEGEYG
jgi:hypothetical protein